MATGVIESLCRQREGDGFFPEAFGETRSGMKPKTSARDYWVKRFDFTAVFVGCAAAPGCDGKPTCYIGWTYEKRVKGGPVKTLIEKRSACEKHARLFAFKKGVKIQEAAA